MKLYNDVFIGYGKKHLKEQFSCTDTPELFMESVKKLGSSWEYYSMPMSYIRNSTGHRSQEIADIDLDNYILCTGCSFTEGIGIPVEARYGEVLSKKLNVDVYNLGIGASGNDMIMYNLFQWLNHVEKKPKLIILQWSEMSRFLRQLGNKTDLANSGVWMEDELNFINAGLENMYFETRTMLFKKMIRQIKSVPIIQIAWHTQPAEDTEVKFVTIDAARDWKHPGIKSNQLLADTIFARVNQLGLLTT